MLSKKEKYLILYKLQDIREEYVKILMEFILFPEYTNEFEHRLELFDQFVDLKEKEWSN